MCDVAEVDLVLIPRVEAGGVVEARLVSVVPAGEAPSGDMSGPVSGPV